MKYGKRIKKEYKVKPADCKNGKGFSVRFRETYPETTAWRGMLKIFEDEKEAQDIVDRLSKMTPLETDRISQGRFVRRHGCSFCADARDYYGNAIKSDDAIIVARYCVHDQCPYEKLMESYGGYEKYDTEARREMEWIQL